MNGFIYIFMGIKSLVREQVVVGVSDIIKGVSGLNPFLETMFSGDICLVILVRPQSLSSRPFANHNSLVILSSDAMYPK